MWGDVETLIAMASEDRDSEKELMIEACATVSQLQASSVIQNCQPRVPAAGEYCNTEYFLLLSSKLQASSIIQCVFVFLKYKSK